MEKEPLKAIDLEVLRALFKRAHLPKTADKISKDLNINYYYTLKIFNKLESKGLCNQWTILGKILCNYLNALKRAKNKRKD
ncbi:hypothetical protein ACOWLS_07625 [Helicobacter pylori]